MCDLEHQGYDTFAYLPAMKILVINCGSSSIKYKLYEMDDKSVLAAGGIEKIGLEDGTISSLYSCPQSYCVNVCPPVISE